MPQNFIESRREQGFLLPPDVRAWLPADHLAWFVIDAVEDMDLDAFYAAYRADGHGRAAYEPLVFPRFAGHLSACGESRSEEVSMPRTKPPFPPEFRREAVKLMRDSDKPLAQLAKDLGVSGQTLRTWRKQEQVNRGELEGISSEQLQELRRLRRENRTLAMEREVLHLKKAAAFFARESEGR
jgi:transposase